MSAEATGWVFRYSPLKGAAFAVHLAMADSVNDQHGNQFWMRIPGLAAKARVSRGAADRAIKQMLECGLLTLITKGKSGPVGGGSTCYLFVMGDDESRAHSATLAESRAHSAEFRAHDAKPEVDTSSLGTQVETQVLSSSDGCAADATIDARSSAISAIGWGLTPVMIDGGQLGPALELCDLMARQLRDRGIRVPATTPHSKGWVTPMEALLRIDGHPAENVASVLTWLDGGRDRTSNFWRTVVLSPNKLRLRWDQMREAVRREQMQSSRNPALDDGTPLSEILGTTDEATG